MGGSCSRVDGSSLFPSALCVHEEYERSRKIDHLLLEEKKQKVLKILLLGPGESGKTTTLKQMRIIHDAGYTEMERIEQRGTILHNLLTGMVRILEQVQIEEIPLSLQSKMDASIVCSTFEKFRIHDELPLTSEVSEAMLRLRETEEISYVLDNTEESVVDDAGRYFIRHLERIRAYDYIPTLEDILKSRIPTQGCVQMTFVIKEFTFRLFDVGGQRSQRKKWIHIFDNVHAVLFITSLSEYTQTLAEDKTTNRMRESLSLFSSICSNEHFVSTAIILFLNKVDLFEEKIRKYPITCVFSKYKGGQNSEDSLKYITKRFLRENRNQKRNIYVHVTCATDTKQIQVVIDSVVDVIIQQTMQKIGIQ